MTWEIDTSTGTPILVFEKCSVIQDEQAYFVLDALKRVAQLQKEVDHLRQGLEFCGHHHVGIDLVTGKPTHDPNRCMLCHDYLKP